MLGMDDNMPTKMMLSNSLETAEHFIKKEWNENKGKFDYIYPKDVLQKGRKTAR